MQQNQSKKTQCVLCSAKLAFTVIDGVLQHPESTFCGVRLTDADGISLDDQLEVDSADGVIYEIGVAPEPAPSLIDLGVDVPSDVIGREDASPYNSAEWALERIFAAAGVPRLGGASGDRGWSSISTFQQCPYKWKRRYIDSRRGEIDKTPKPVALEVGTIVHTFLAIGYAGIIDPNYPLTQTQVRADMLALMVTPDVVHEAWRLTTAYWLNYAHDDWTPLAVEQLLVDPRTKQSCRVDVIMRRETPAPGLPVGTYLWDHKTKARFDFAALNSWKNDGEIIGLTDIYARVKAHKRFGDVVGLCVNIIGKQKVPQFHRTWVFPPPTLVKDHRRSLQIWSAAIDTARALGSFPKARAACVNSYGYLCDEFDHCAHETNVTSSDINDITL